MSHHSSIQLCDFFPIFGIYKPFNNYLRKWVSVQLLSLLNIILSGEDYSPKLESRESSNCSRWSRYYQCSGQTRWQGIVEPRTSYLQEISVRANKKKLNIWGVLLRKLSLTLTKPQITVSWTNVEGDVRITRVCSRNTGEWSENHEKRFPR